MVTWVVDGKSSQLTREEVERFMQSALEHFSTAVHVRMDLFDTLPTLVVFYGPVDDEEPDTYICEPDDIRRTGKELQIYLKSQKPVLGPSS